MKNKHIVLVITGGIAAYKSAYLASALAKAGADVHVVMTKNACEFITPLTFETLTKNAVTTDTFDRSTPFEVTHVSLAQKADLILVAPASANFIGKAAAGIADDFASTLLLAATCPIVFSPAMNTAMFENAIVQRNIQTLKNHGMLFIEPAEGRLACKDFGKGRMPEPEELFAYVEKFFSRKKDLIGKKLLITAGPTVERIDDVRYLTNRSSGKMGYAIAQAALDRGADVTLVSGPVHIEPPKGARVVNIESAAQMRNAVFASLNQADIIIKAAAVADFTPKAKFNGKIKKGGEGMQLDLVRTEDILLSLGKEKGNKILVGFAAEAADLLENAQSKLERKNVDMICANDISRNDIGFGGNENAITMLFKDGRRENIDKCSKAEAADRILDAILTIKA
ncbi:MAG: bifunctional phosphopantothenoylcysteine decarboxylase/phosphopantothenate--cysteine ligase CoaBC [Christensenellaceae bacterium]|nr:bifunctional phosphopantothenoylcysteine decarboxylase/phosphopantothenate--cysteine ligase CoaBC [Christensenellaceae bacterium]